MKTKVEDIWIKSSCNVCFSQCAIRVHRVNGVITEITGNPDCPTSRGGICGKGAAGIMLLYDKNRVNYPLKRTNPVKGIGIDPGWVRISWDHALELITDKLKQIKQYDPRKLLTISTVLLQSDAMRFTYAFAQAIGGRNFYMAGTSHCGAGSHLFSGLMQLAWTKMPDPNYINYYLNFGCPSGFGAYYCATGMANRMAQARRRGMKHVTIEPWMGMPGNNSDEWVPIKPGTDAALALAMVSLLLNEYKIYDAESIKKYTNGTYLITTNGTYLRDKDEKPLIWDIADNCAKSYDKDIRDPAIEGRYLVNGIHVTPAFAVIREHVRNYTPGYASKITTVPEKTIRRLAKEFGEAARIGETITIDGHVLPYRPVAVGYFKGASAHKHSALINMSLELLQEIVGANNVPGGCLGTNSRSLGYPDTGQPFWEPVESTDGLMKVGSWATAHIPWPPNEARKPETLGLTELVPTAGTSPMAPIAVLDGKKYQISYKPEVVLQTGGNYIMTCFDPKIWEQVLTNNTFIASFNLYLDESSDFADVVLPDTCYLERLDLSADRDDGIIPVDDWAYHIRQPAIEPLFERRQSQQVILHLAEKLGILPATIRNINTAFRFKAPFLLDENKKYTWEQMVDMRFKGFFGEKHGLEWFKENGLIKWPKRVEEIYWRPFIKGRIPIYFEFFKQAGLDIEAIKRKYKLPDFDTSDFQALPDWKPCASYDNKDGFDLIGIYYRVPFQSFTSTYNNPWLDDIANVNPYIYRVAINTKTAESKGIKDGDWILIESEKTRHIVEARAYLTEAIHPEVVAYASGGGHWARSLPIASQEGKGICPEWLIPLNWEQVDAVSFNLDLCVKVKISKSSKTHEDN